MKFTNRLFNGNHPVILSWINNGKNNNSNGLNGVVSNNSKIMSKNNTTNTNTNTNPNSFFSINNNIIYTFLLFDSFY